MNIFAISGFVNGISALFFGLIVFLNNPKKLVNKTFGLMTFSLAIWSFAYGLWQLAQDKESALIYTRILSIGSTFIPIFFLHWIFALLNLQEKRKTVLALGYILTLIFLSFSLTPLYVKDVIPRLSFLWWPQAGIVYNFYLAFGYGGLIGYAGYELIRIYKKTEGHLKEQIKYILLAVVIGFGGGATNFPLWYGVSLPPYGNFLIFLYPFILSYAILKHRLMDIRVVLSEFLVAVIGFILLVEAIIAKSFYEALFRIIIFLVFCFFGWLLIKNVLNEIKRRLELERLTQELKKAYDKLEELDKAKSEFLSIASHQLRTPLTAIKGYISMMLEKTYGELPEKIVKPLENVSISNERLLKLVNDLLNISRIESGKVEMNLRKTSLEKIIESVTEELRNIAKEKGIYLKFEKPEKVMPGTLVDQEKIRQVIMNVIENAIHYTEKGGITIKIQNIKSKIQIIIADTGAGIAKNELTKMFESFSRGAAGTRLYTEGVGLGLYVAKKFIEIHHGKIWAESKGKGKGSTFYIELSIK